jgi:hypothetical protein
MRQAALEARGLSDAARLCFQLNPRSDETPDSRISKKAAASRPVSTVMTPRQQANRSSLLSESRLVSIAARCSLALGAIVKSYAKLY